jgi:D-alanyl-D-alanine carboxypeptidase
MTRMRSGAGKELPCGVVGLLVVAVALAIPSDGAGARYHRQASQDAHHSAHAEGYSPPSSSIVVDGNTGKVLQESNPGAPRHPASLTKIMTLYLLFERLGVHKIKLDTPLKVSAKAAGQPPSTLGLKAGQTIAVEDVIKAVVTRSANDAAVVIAENLGGDEGRFAKLMTQKARALGMSRTTYVNASGLPNDDQITTARDQALLGRAIQERYPRYYKYFSTQSFEFRGEAIRNHNHLLGSMDGVDGIKTGFTHASGFNLVTSVHRDGHYIVAVVLGGRSALERDAHMRELINAHIKEAGLRRTAPVLAERTSQHRQPQVLGFAKAPLSSGADPTPGTPVTASSSNSIQSLPVKTISYRTAPAQAAALASMLLAAATLQADPPAANAPRAQLSDALSIIAPADRSVAAPARGPQLVHEQPASMPGAAQPRTQVSNARNDGTRPSPDVGTPNIKTQPTVIASANAGEILERSAKEDARSPSIQQTIVREVASEAADTSIFAKNETERLIRAEAEARTTDDTSTVQPREGTTESLRVTPSMVFLFLAIGLPWVGVLAWLVIKADTARGERLARNHLQLKATGHLDYNKRGVDRLDDQREADRMDDFLANVARSLTTRPRNASFTSAKHVQLNQEAIEAACARLVALRHRVVQGMISATRTTEIA